MPVRTAVESMNGARFVHDQLELCGWRVEIADALKVKGLAPLACKTDRIDLHVLAELCRRSSTSDRASARPPHVVFRTGPFPVTRLLLPRELYRDESPQPTRPLGLRSGRKFVQMQLTWEVVRCQPPTTRSPAQ